MTRATIPLMFVPLSMVFATGCQRGNAPAAQLPPPVVNATPNSRVSVVVDAQGYHPSTVNAPAGRPLTLVFTRVTDEGCGQQLVFPSLNIRRDLPLNQPVQVTVTPTSGQITFTCGMNMYRGAIVAQQ